MAFSFEEWLPPQQRRVEVLLESRMQFIAGRSPAKIAEAMRYSWLDGGKRLRPVLCLAFADAVSGSSLTGTVADDAAAALEAIHTYSLIHDDLPAMDDDDLRRGRPTNHKVYGEAMAILAGDALLTAAFEVLTNGPELALRGRLTAELAFASGAAGMVGGQVLDVAEDRPAELAYLQRLHSLKTGALIKASCRMGAIAGGADDAKIAAASEYGDAVGTAFQIADDILDVTASAEAMGKPTGADAAAGRFTYPAVVGLERARQMADELVDRAIKAAEFIEGADGPLAALARYSVGRKN
jgi:geranylgeranyl diphosphate synthase type II